MKTLYILLILMVYYKSGKMEQMINSISETKPTEVGVLAIFCQNLAYVRIVWSSEDTNVCLES